MAANAGIISFYRASSITAFERHRRCIPIRDDLNTVQALKHGLKNHLVSFLGLKELSLKYTASENLKSKYIIWYRHREEKVTTLLSQRMNSGNWSFQTHWMAQEAKGTVCIFNTLVPYLFY